jgi:hypothetical protein
MAPISSNLRRLTCFFYFKLYSNKTKPKSLMVSKDPRSAALASRGLEPRRRPESA